MKLNEVMTELLECLQVQQRSDCRLEPDLSLKINGVTAEVKIKAECAEQGNNLGMYLALRPLKSP